MQIFTTSKFMDIKKITVTGGTTVFKPVIEGEDGEKKRTRQTRKRPIAYRVTGKLDETGSLIDGGDPAPIQPPVVPTTPLIVPRGGTITSASAEIKKIQVNPVVTVPDTPAGGAEPSSPNTKVLLGGKKPHRVKVLLTKKRHRIDVVEEKVVRARKIQVGVRALKKNVTRAKRISKTAKALPLDTIRAELVKAGIIKESSKAPEGVLRAMYADAKLVSSQTL